MILRFHMILILPVDTAVVSFHLVFIIDIHLLLLARDKIHLKHVWSKSKAVITLGRLLIYQTTKEQLGTNFFRQCFL